MTNAEQGDTVWTLLRGHAAFFPNLKSGDHMTLAGAPKGCPGALESPCDELAGAPSSARGCWFGPEGATSFTPYDDARQAWAARAPRRGSRARRRRCPPQDAARQGKALGSRASRPAAR